MQATSHVMAGECPREARVLVDPMMPRVFLAHNQSVSGALGRYLTCMQLWNQSSEIVVLSSSHQNDSNTHSVPHYFTSSSSLRSTAPASPPPATLFRQWSRCGSPLAPATPVSVPVLLRVVQGSAMRQVPQLCHCCPPPRVPRPPLCPPCPLQNPARCAAVQRAAFQRMRTLLAGSVTQTLAGLATSGAWSTECPGTHPDVVLLVCCHNTRGLASYHPPPPVLDFLFC